MEHAVHVISDYLLYNVRWLYMHYLIILNTATDFLGRQATSGCFNKDKNLVSMASRQGLAPASLLPLVGPPDGVSVNLNKIDIAH